MNRLLAELALVPREGESQLQLAVRRVGVVLGIGAVVIAGTLLLRVWP